ncbi:hypothetical protein [Dokdonella sp.]|uniref:hypothetical protein n=1 Tax=Dokdonella sp. TaxID=2291710 RepID=UPI002F41D106
MRSDRRAAAPTGALPWLAAACGCAFDLVASWPGQMSFDSASAWWQARNGMPDDVVPPGFVLAWRALLVFVDGPQAMFAWHLVLFWSGLALFAGALARSRGAAAAVLLLVGAAPLPLLWRGHVWTDVALFSALLAATGALAHAHVHGRRSLLPLAAAAMLYAGAMRHNALAAVLPLALWWGWLAVGARARSLASLRVVAAALALSLGVFAGNRLLAARVPVHVPLWPLAAEYDLAALSIASGTMRLPPFLIGDGLDVDELAESFREWSALPLLTGTRHGVRAPIAEPLLSERELASLRRAWLGAIARQPLDWASHRLRVARALLGPHAADWPQELVFFDGQFARPGNPPVAANTGALHAALMRAARALRTGSALAAWPYLFAGLLVVPLAWRRRGDAPGAAALALLASAWAYALPLLVVTASAETRYLAWSCVASLLAFAAVVFGARASRTVAAEASQRPARLLAESMRGMPMNTVQRYMFTIDDLPKARGESHELSFQGGSAESFAALLQQALREPSLWQRWKSMQPDPDAVDPALGASDPAATVEAHQSDVHVSVDVRSSLPHAVIKHRMTLLVGKHWTLRDVSAA